MGVAQFPWNSWQNCEEPKKKDQKSNVEFPTSVFSFPLELRVHSSGKTKPAVVYIAALFEGVSLLKLRVNGFNVPQHAAILM